MGPACAAHLASLYTLYHTHLHLHLQLQLRVDVPQRDEAALPGPALVLGAALRQLQGDPQPAVDEVAGGEGGHLGLRLHHKRWVP